MPYDAKFDRLPIFALYDLKGSQDVMVSWAPGLPEFPTAPNRVARMNDVELCHIGINRWLLRAAICEEEKLETILRPSDAPPEISVVRVSDTLRFFRITGPDAAAVLSIGCPLDVHPEVFDDDAVSYTEFFGLKALVLRCDDGFDCAVEQSFGDMVEDYLSRAMA